jgi:hypothetical protein
MTNREEEGEEEPEWASREKATEIEQWFKTAEPQFISETYAWPVSQKIMSLGYMCDEVQLLLPRFCANF